MSYSCVFLIYWNPLCHKTKQYFRSVRPAFSGITKKKVAFPSGLTWITKDLGTSAGIHHGAMDLSLSPTPQTKSDLTTNNPWDSHRLALFAPPRMWKIMKHHPFCQTLQKTLRSLPLCMLTASSGSFKSSCLNCSLSFETPVQQMVQTYSWWLQCLDFCPQFLGGELQCETPMLGENSTTRMPKGKKSS